MGKNNNTVVILAMVGLFIATWVAMGGALFWLFGEFKEINNRMINIENDIEIIKEDIEGVYVIMGEKHGDTFVKKVTNNIPDKASAEISADLLTSINQAVSRFDRYKLFEIIEKSDISLEPTEYNRIGVMYYNSKRYPEAIRNFDIAKDLEPNFVYAHNNLGITYNQLGEFDQAIVPLGKTLELEPDNIDALNNLGWAYNRLERYNESERLLNNAIRIEPNYKQAYINLSQTYSKTNQFDRAINVLNKAIEIDPTYSLIYLNFARIYSLEEKADDAIQNLKKAVGLGYDDYKSIEEESDYDFIRDDPRYIKIINKLKKK